jgi:hypothetical protein
MVLLLIFVVSVIVSSLYSVLYWNFRLSFFKFWILGKCDLLCITCLMFMSAPIYWVCIYCRN